ELPAAVLKLKPSAFTPALVPLSSISGGPVYPITPLWLHPSIVTVPVHVGSAAGGVIVFTPTSGNMLKVIVSAPAAVLAAIIAALNEPAVGVKLLPLS